MSLYAHPPKIEMLTEKGKWSNVDFKRLCPEMISAEVALPCYGVAILKVR